MLNQLDATLADVQARNLLAARVDYEWFSEMWGDVEGMLTNDKPDACVVFRDEMGRIENALLGHSVPDGDVEVGARALDHLRATVLGLIAPLPTLDRVPAPSPFDDPLIVAWEQSHLLVFRVLAKILDCFTRLLDEPHQEHERGDSLCPPPVKQSCADDSHKHRRRHVPAFQRARCIIAQRLATSRFARRRLIHANRGITTAAASEIRMPIVLPSDCVTPSRSATAVAST